MYPSLGLSIILLFESFFAFVINFVCSVYTFEKNHKAYLFVSALITIINIVFSIALILLMNNDKMSKYGKQICQQETTDKGRIVINLHAGNSKCRIYDH